MREFGEVLACFSFFLTFIGIRRFSHWCNPPMASTDENQVHSMAEEGVEAPIQVFCAVFE